jgi:hypothetical protein
MLGYVAELQLKKYLTSFSDIRYLGKDDDHNRKNKGDCLIEYKGKQFRIEVKSLQTKTVNKIIDKNGNVSYSGKTQVDASDRRIICLPDGSELNTTCLLRGEFDVLAVNCFMFEEDWRYVFSKNTDLPVSSYKSYTDYQRQHLIATLVPVTWPPVPPFYDTPIPVLDSLLEIN